MRAVAFTPCAVLSRWRSTEHGLRYVVACYNAIQRAARPLVWSSRGECRLGARLFAWRLAPRGITVVVG